MNFILHIPSAIPCLPERLVNYLNEVYCYLEETKFDFFL